MKLMNHEPFLCNADLLMLHLWPHQNDELNPNTQVKLKHKLIKSLLKEKDFQIYVLRKKRPTI